MCNLVTYVQRRHFICAMFAASLVTRPRIADCGSSALVLHKIMSRPAELSAASHSRSVLRVCARPWTARHRARRPRAMACMTIANEHFLREFVYTCDRKYCDHDFTDAGDLVLVDYQEPPLIVAHIADPRHKVCSSA